MFYLSVYFLLIPIWGGFYVIAAPHGFYAPYARLEPGALEDADRVAGILEDALTRSLDAHPAPTIVVGNWQLDWRSLAVDNVTATDVGQLKFRVRFNADGAKENTGERQLGWSAFITVNEQPIAQRISGRPNESSVHRVPEADTSKYRSPFSEHDADVLQALFPSRLVTPGLAASIMTVTGEEDTQLRKFIQGSKGDPSGFSNQLGRMVYLSAVVITTLGLGDIVPITALARSLVAAEALLGIMMAGLFLNALAYRAGLREEGLNQQKK
jgi:hypothetical protein